MLEKMCKYAFKVKSVMTILMEYEMLKIKEIDKVWTYSCMVLQVTIT
jgi:hypothetical protein